MLIIFHCQLCQRSNKSQRKIIHSTLLRILAQNQPKGNPWKQKQLCHPFNHVHRNKSQSKNNIYMSLLAQQMAHRLPQTAHSCHRPNQVHRTKSHSNKTMYPTLRYHLQAYPNHHSNNHVDRPCVAVVVSRKLPPHRVEVSAFIHHPLAPRRLVLQVLPHLSFPLWTPSIVNNVGINVKLPAGMSKKPLNMDLLLPIREIPMLSFMNTTI